MPKPIPLRIWRTLYVVRHPDGFTLLVQKSDDGCSRTVRVEGH